jgi:hypothetical protein
MRLYNKQNGSVRDFTHAVDAIDALKTGLWDKNEPQKPKPKKRLKKNDKSSG